MLWILFRLGFHHLTEAGAWDHQLFLATIALAYVPALWRKWIVLATCFAIGHTLAIAGMSAGWLPQGLSWVEPAIVASIGALALFDLASLTVNPLGLSRRGWNVVAYGLVLGFGVVHGLGFGSAFLRVVAPDTDGLGLAASLLAFTAGVEVAQVLILAVLWLAAWVVFDLWQWYPLLLRRLLLGAIAAYACWALVGG